MGASPQTSSTEVVTVTVNVTGQLAQTDQEVVNRLVPISPKTLDEASVNTRIDLQTEETLITGDHIDAPLSYDVPKATAESLGLNFTSDGSVVDADAGASGGSGGGRRRRLTQTQHAARRMILDFHGTRRTLQEFNDLTTVLRQLGVQNQIPKAVVPKSGGKKNGGAKDLIIVGGKPLNITSVAFIFSSSECGIKPVLTEAQVKARWFDAGDSAPVTATLQRAYRVCSHEKLYFLPDNNIVVGPVDVPCTGSTKVKGAYDLRKGFGNKKNLDSEMNGLYELAKNWLQQKGGQEELIAKLPYLRRKIVVWPWNNQAQLKAGPELVDWPGMGSMGCPGNANPNGIMPDCFTWMNNALTDTSLDISVLMQELGHNIGLSHSSRDLCSGAGCEWWINEYGDDSDFMGSAGPPNGNKSYVCASAPQAYKAGWASPQTELDATTITAGTGWADTTIPSMHVTDKSFIRIAIDQTDIATQDRFKPQRALYISYRVAQPLAGYDSGLNRDINARVWVHEYNDTANGFSADTKKPPRVLAMLDLPAYDPKTKKLVPAPPSWPNLSSRFVLPKAFGAGDGLVIMVKSKTNVSAVVSLCRNTVTSESVDDGTCMDGVDNDCDGLPDDLDPDCGAEDNSSPPPPPMPMMRKSPPPAPKPPSPRPPRQSPPPPPLPSTPVADSAPKPGKRPKGNTGRRRA
ncbi:hypothetical protein HXX76_004896 [Chlamydomonas incerta]|uniref:Peptidase M11 gametolysin domain-containing protein n=1 Tax=Chlamydomonas incerta TaxID=51695 RepID=A0A835W6V7_CHLIN|nr:hypothetical protein HXX76_004896 [Chlamydomonas incerta]|eukprot:KAG2439543.1 hypothetical protein HXX76_004896 [Chlamydomonas incerta]